MDAISQDRDTSGSAVWYISSRSIHTSLIGFILSGSVIGMVLLFVLLMTNSLNVRWIEEGTQFMIRHLNLFFIPATVGIMDYFHVFAGKGILLIFIVL